MRIPWAFGEFVEVETFLDGTSMIAGPMDVCFGAGGELAGDDGELFMFMWTLSVVRTGGGVWTVDDFGEDLKLLDGSCARKIKIMFI